MRLILAAPTLMLALLFALPAAAETRQHGNVIFDLPEGWRIGKVRQDGTQVIWSDLPDDACQTCAIYIATGDAGTVALDAYLTAQTLRFAEPAEAGPQVEPMASEMVNIHGRPGGMQGQKVDGKLQILIAVQLFGRMELIGFETPGSDPDTATENLRIFERDVMPMIEGARFVSEGAKALMPAPQPGARQGVYWGTSTWWSLGLDGMMQMQIDHRWLTFWPDGLFYDGTPPAGIGAFDRASALARGDMSWGSYREAGGKLVLSFASGEVQELAVTDAGLETGGNTLWLIEPLPDGTKINGSISTMFYSGFSPGSGVSGGASASSLTEFHPDGSWTRDSSGGAFGNFDQGGGFATSADNLIGGRYEVKDGLVIQYAKDGSVHATNYIYKADNAIWIGSDLLAGG